MRLSTKTKIRIASTAQRPILWSRKLAGLNPSFHCSRGGVKWCLDIREGIDFSIFLLGSFEPSTSKALTKLVRPGDCVIDVGANIGAHTLPLALKVGETGKVIAFEPTEYACLKLRQNVALNPILRERIDIHQFMLADHMESNLETTIYSSWPLNPSTALHALHGGRMMETTGASVVTLDYFAEVHSLSKIDLIKIDVDGHEKAVIDGGKNTIIKFSPILVMELTAYTLAERGASLGELLELLKSLGYNLYNEKTGALLPSSLKILQAKIPQGYSQNIIAAVMPPF